RCPGFDYVVPGNRRADGGNFVHIWFKAFHSFRQRLENWGNDGRQNPLRSVMTSASFAKATSGSTIQNSMRWRLVLDFSARKVGPKQYTLPNAAAVASLYSWPLWVR